MLSPACLPSPIQYADALSYTQARSSHGVANLYPAPVDASMDVATVQADAVVEGKLLRQVDTVRPCRDVGFAILLHFSKHVSQLNGNCPSSSLVSPWLC